MSQPARSPRGTRCRCWTSGSSPQTAVAAAVVVAAAAVAAGVGADAAGDAAAAAAVGGGPPRGPRAPWGGAWCGCSGRGRAPCWSPAAAPPPWSPSPRPAATARPSPAWRPGPRPSWCWRGLLLLYKTV